MKVKVEIFNFLRSQNLATFAFLEVGSWGGKAEPKPQVPEQEQHQRHVLAIDRQQDGC